MSEYFPFTRMVTSLTKMTQKTSSHTITISLIASTGKPVVEVRRRSKRIGEIHDGYIDWETDSNHQHDIFPYENGNLSSLKLLDLLYRNDLGSKLSYSDFRTASSAKLLKFWNVQASVITLPAYGYSKTGDRSWLGTAHKHWTNWKALDKNEAKQRDWGRNR